MCHLIQTLHVRCVQGAGGYDLLYEAMDDKRPMRDMSNHGDHVCISPLCLRRAIAISTTRCHGLARVCTSQHTRTGNRSYVPCPLSPVPTCEHIDISVTPWVNQHRHRSAYRGFYLVKPSTLYLDQNVYGKVTGTQSMGTASKTSLGCRQHGQFIRTLRH